MNRSHDSACTMIAEWHSARMASTASSCARLRLPNVHANESAPVPRSFHQPTIDEKFAATNISFTGVKCRTQGYRRANSRAYAARWIGSAGSRNPSIQSGAPK